MVERVSVNPDRIRCWGNIVSPKTSTDFYKYSSTVTTGTDTVDGESRTVYSSGYLAGSYLTVTGDRLVSHGSESFTVTATLKNNSNSAITGATLKCIVNDTVLGTGTTDSNGSCTFTVPVVEEYMYVIRVVYDGTNSVAGCFGSLAVYVGVPTNLTVSCANDVMMAGDTNYLIGKLTGTFGNETDKGVPYQSVSFYEEFTPSHISVYATVNPVINGNDTVIKAGLRDTDGSAVQGDALKIYGPQDMDIFEFNAPTEQSFLSTVTSGDHSSPYVTDTLKFPLPTNFELSFDFKTNISGCRFNLCRHYSNVQANPLYSLFFGVNSSGEWEYGFRTTSTDNTTIEDNDGEYHTLKITRQGDTIEYYYDNESQGTETCSWIGDNDYTFYWSYWKPGTMTVKNIQLKQIEGV